MKIEKRTKGISLLQERLSNSIEKKSEISSPQNKFRDKFQAKLDHSNYRQSVILGFIALLNSGCNLFGGIDTPSGDAQLLSAARACFDQGDFGPDVKRPVTFRFLKEDIQVANVHPEPGDIIMYNEVYYHADNVNENQLIVGKDSDYSYSSGLENFGASYSVVILCHYISPDALGITQQRL